jgi:spore germination cell wall hydrolase CwlJ-like protein
MLISFTADAGQEVPSGASHALLTSKAAVMPRDLMPSPRAMATSFGETFGRGLLHEARLVVGAPEQIDASPEEVEPRADMKRNASVFPEIDRSHRGDPLVGLRPSIEGNLRHKGGVAWLRAESLTFDRDGSRLASSFAPVSGDAPGPDSVAHFEPSAERESLPEAAPEAVIVPNWTATGTPRAAAAATRAEQGATTAAPRAVALSSTTPFDSDEGPVVALGPNAASADAGVTAVPRKDDKIDYLAMIPSEKLESEKRCLAQAIYFEARSEPEAGQAAVAQVILNRMSSGLYPSTICGVVFQNRRHHNACQFSFTCNGHALRVHDAEAWTQATRVADDVLGGRTWLAHVGDATHYHANYVRPRWARRLTRMDVIGKHVFYRLKPGQT